VRAVSELPEPRIPGYTAVDMGFDWQPNAHLDVSLLAKNVFGAGHVEFAPGPIVAASDFDRSAMVKLLWRW